MMNDEQAAAERRLAALEEAMRALKSELAELRASMGARAESRPESRPGLSPESRPEAVARPVLVPPPPRKTAQMPPRATVSGVTSGGFEQAIGRYGTLVVATMAILLGVGAFLKWAVERGLLGPHMRVALGAVAAAVLAWLGIRLRTKGSATFGNALLAIALAITHLVAWGAGPVLELIPSKLALAVAAAASIALAVLALRSGEQILFLLGLGGALIAPFVTSTGAGSKLELLAFGFIVLSAAIYALRDPAWRIAPRLISPLALGYMAAAANIPRGDFGIGAIYWPTAFALLLAIVALVVGAQETRRGIVKTMLFLVAMGIIFAGGRRDVLPWNGLVYGVLGTLTVHALRRRTRLADAASKDTWMEVVGLPLLFLFTVLVVEDTWERVEGMPIALAWAAIAGVAVYVDRASARARHLTVVLVALLMVVANRFYGDPADELTARAVGFLAVPGFALVAALGVLAFVRVPGYALMLPIGAGLIFATIRTATLLDEREAWQYTPFVNGEALVGLVVVGAFGLLSWLAPKGLVTLEGERQPWTGTPFSRIVRLFGPGVAFLWVRAELLEAYSWDMSKFLLICFYALSGVGTIVLGRKLRIDGLRQAGLALSLFAAGKTVVGASSLGSIGLQVGSYLVVGVFLLGVGYLYRAAPGEDELPPDDPAAGAAAQEAA